MCKFGNTHGGGHRPRHAAPGRSWRERAQNWHTATMKAAKGTAVIAWAVGGAVEAVREIIWLVEQVSQWLG